MLLRRASATAAATAAAAAAVKDKLAEKAQKVKGSITPSKAKPETVLAAHLKLICVHLRTRLLTEEVLGKESTPLFDPEVSVYKYTDDLRTLAVIAVESGPHGLNEAMDAYNIQTLSGVLKLVLSSLEQPLVPIEVSCKMHVLYKSKGMHLTPLPDPLTPVTAAELTEVLSSNAPRHAINIDVIAQVLMLLAKDKTSTPAKMAKVFGTLLFMPSPSSISQDDLMAAGGAEYLKNLCGAVVYVTEHLLLQVNVVFASMVIDKVIEYKVRGMVKSGVIAHSSMRSVKYRAEFDFEAQGPNEINLRAGEVVVVLDTSGEDGWWTGRNEAGETGLFPQDYVSVDENVSLPSAAEILRPVEEAKVARAVGQELHELVKQGNRALLDVSNSYEGSGEFPAVNRRSMQRSSSSHQAGAVPSNERGGEKMKQLSEMLEARLDFTD